MAYDVDEYLFDAEIGDVLNLVPHKSRQLKGIPLKADSLTLKCFKKHGTRCWLCGLEATHFVISRQHTQKAFTAKLVNGNPRRWVHFTKDHIIPKSWGGGDAMHNLRTMCEPCNQVLGRLYREIFTAVMASTKKYDIEEHTGDLIKMFSDDGTQLLAKIDRVAKIIGENKDRK